MANTLQTKTRLTAVKERMNEILRTLSYDYDNGKIKSPAELHHRIYQELQAFYASIGKSTLLPIQAWGPPYSADHNLMVQQTYNDFRSLYREVDLMTKDLAENFEQVELERQSFNDRLARVESLMKGVEGNIREADYAIVFREDFTDYDHLKKEGIKGTPASISTNEGLMTLVRTDEEIYNEYATITVAEGTGLPGNTHIVRSVNGTLKFDGQEHMHIDVADILDRNSDTWFEYEAIELTDAARKKTLGMDFEYREAIHWAIVSPGVRLVLRIDFNKAKVINWLSLVPFIPSDRGATAATIEKIVISDEKGGIVTAGVGDAFDATKGYMFDQQQCQTILLYLTQKTGYETNVGHFYFKQANTERIAIMDAAQDDGGARVHGPVPSITNLGVSYDTGTQKIGYPVQRSGDRVADQLGKKNALFSVPATPTNVFAGLEQVGAYRYMIGLRDITMAMYTFGVESEYVSLPFEASTPFTSIELDVDADIPSRFDAGSDWIEYFVSIDEGQNWNPIYPRNIYRSQAITKYLINSSTPKESRIDEVGYLDSPTEVYSVQVRIVLRRPEGTPNAEYYTPILYGYELYVNTQEELI